MDANRDPTGKIGVPVSNFDYSVDNFLASMELIRGLCGLPGDESFDASEIERFSSTITFLREWKYFSYGSKNINFACDLGNGQVKDESDGISLPQFSSAAVPKMVTSADEASCLDSDFVLHAGGLVWAMDWCPRNLEICDSNFKCEYLAVSAHPPGSSYHKIGVPLVGRGIIQIWCILTLEENLEISPLSQRRPTGNSRGTPGGSHYNQLHPSVKNSNGKWKDKLTIPRPRGRPKGSCKKQPHSTVNDLNERIESPLPGGSLVPSVSGHLGDTPLETHFSDTSSGKVETVVPKRRRRPSKTLSSCLYECDPMHHNIVALPVSAGINGNLKPSQPRCRGRHRKTPTASADELVQMSSVDPGKYEIGLSTLKGPETLNESVESPLIMADLSGKQDMSTVECHKDSSPLQSSRQFGPLGENNILSSFPDDSTEQLEPFVPQRRGRPKKNLKLSVKKHVQTFGDDLGKNLSMLLTLKPPGDANENMLALSVSVNAKDKDESLAPMHGGELVPIPSVAQCTLTPSLEFGECSSSMQILGGLDGPCGNNVAFSSPADLKVTHNSNTCRKKRGIKGKPMAFSCLTDSQSSTGNEHNDLEITLATMIHDSNTCRKKRRIKCKTMAFSHPSDSQLSTCKELNNLAMTLAPADEECSQGGMVLSKEMTYEKFHIPKDSALPKVVLCLAHMGKVAWDVKWRPVSVNDSEGMHHLGYLAALLGNGSLEVWEVPHPNMVKILHASHSSDGTDPRFVKLKPIFRCSKVLCGDRQSIPLTLEWSPSAPHDLILAGCHDGTVALWKFSKQQNSQDMKPMLCFSADSVPIRSLAWAPDESNVESANLIVTAGHEGMKLWDIRDPYHPLWEYTPVQRIILSMEWLKDPRCLMMSFDDGALRILSLWKMVNDVLVTGEPSGATKQNGLHSYFCSQFAMWSFQVSRATGLAAYCTADGSTQYFQLTAKAVEKDKHRSRVAHFLCGSFINNDNAIRIGTPLPKVPLPNMPLKKIPTGMGDAPLCSFVSDPYQARDGTLSLADARTPPVVKSKKKNSEEKPEEKFPPKEVAVHKVRWNMNRGCERWLCYGGAAGIVRCQKIIVSKGKHK